MHYASRITLPVFTSAMLFVATTARPDVVINEIMYHPLQPQFGAEPIGEEFVELFNTGTNAVNLNGWHFNKGISFTFSNITLAAGAYLVVSPDLDVFTDAHPGVTNVVGPCQGTLGNNGETIELKDADGNVVDSVAYGTQGDWALHQRGVLDNSHRGWQWFSEADGLGKSMERRNPYLTVDSGQNWASSAAAGGSPGRANSAFTNNVAPLILNLSHFPLVPGSAQNVAISAHIVDEQTSGLTVTLYWRVDSTTPPPFTSAPMFDDGAHGDGGASDGFFGAIIPAQANNTVIEFYVQATDAGGRTATWPAPAIAAPDGAGPTGQVVNALFQVDDNSQNAYGVLSPTHPVYKLIMTENERVELDSIPKSAPNSNAEMNGTWITLDGTGQEFRYNCGYRNRGHGSRTIQPPNYRVNIPNDRRWKGIRALNVNSDNTPAQVLGATLAKKAGLAGADSHAAQIRVNNANLALTTARMLGAYAANEEMDSDWANEHFPFDSAGNIYRAIRDITPPDWVYRGPDVNSYVNTYFKTDNTSAYDWSDLIQLHRIVGTNDLFTTANVRQVANVEQWMVYYAVQSIWGNNETSPNTGYNDDYFLYRGVNDPRFMLIYYDNDTILSPTFGARANNDGIFSAEANNGMGAMTTRFLEWPDFKPIYYATLQRLINGPFGQAEFESIVDETLSTYPNTTTRSSVISGIKSYMATRRTTIQGLINGLVPPATNVPIATVSGEPRSPTPFASASLAVGGNDIVAYKYKFNSGSYSAEVPVSTPITLSGLSNNSTNTVYVIGKNSAGAYQDVTNATASKTWIVKTSLPTVRLNEILARNDSAVNHNGTFPDLIELFNEGASSVDLSGLRLTDDPANPNKFTFPAGTPALAGSDYLVLYANDPDATPGIHLGFSLGQNGAAVYLYDKAGNDGPGGPQLLDSVVFGLQIADKSIGRFANGDWFLCQPSFGATNVIQSLGTSSNLVINEWLTSGALPFVDDFIELYNADPLPVALGGLHLTDEPIGAPALHTIASLSFIAGGGGHAVFIADGNADAGANHLDFSLSSEVGEISLTDAYPGQLPITNYQLPIINTVSYGPQHTGVSQGRCPDGSTTIAFLTTPTPGAPNLCPAAPPPPVTTLVMSYTNFWKYDTNNNYDAVNWTASAYNDSAWPSGRGVLAKIASGSISQPINTVIALTSGRATYYFRGAFVAPTNSNLSALQISHFFDDGAVVYLNGKEAYRYNMPTGTPTFSTLASSGVSGPPGELGPFSFPMTNMVAGTNILAVEVHQNPNTSADVFMGLKLEAILSSGSAAGSGIAINEVLANNASVAEADGSTPDWIELYNPSTNAVDLGDSSLSDSTLNPRRWVFPSPTLLPAQTYMVIRFDSGAPVSATNTGFGLKATGDAVYLFARPADGGGLLDFVTFGLQAPDYSIGRYPLGTTNWALTLPSGGAPNILAPLGDATHLKINEWMASPLSGDDWFEVYNPDPQPVAVGNYWLTDDLNDRQKSHIPPLSFISANTNGYQQFRADSNVGSGADHVGFKLAGQTGEAIGISKPDGSLIDGITFGPQDTGISEGRLPDGSSNIMRFPGTASPGDANYVTLADVVVNEVLTHTDPPLEDAIELHNVTGADIDLSGWFLSDAKTRLQKFRVPNGTTITANGYLVFYEYQFNGPATPLPFALSSSKGDEVYLSVANTNGLLSGYRASVKFGAAENGVSFGRFQTSVGIDFPAMSDLSLGTTVRKGDPTNLITLFRTGLGAPNPYPRIGPIVISEIMYHPPDLGTNDNTRDEFIELYNVSDHAVVLYDSNFPTNTWRLRSGVDFDFPTGVSLAAGASLVVVSFDPATNGASLAGFQAQYGSNATLLGPYSGKLDNGGESVELLKPDPPNPDGFVPYVLVERIDYGDSAPWPTNADGAGYSLQRLNVLAYGNEPTNWIGALPTLGRALDRDGDGLPDWWEIAYGLDPLSNDADQDLDNDGVSNFNEFLSGTDPRDPQSFLRIDISPISNGAVLHFRVVAGRRYTIERRDIVTDSWSPLADIPLQTFTHDMTINDTDGLPQRYYRLLLHP